MSDESQGGFPPGNTPPPYNPGAQRPGVQPPVNNGNDVPSGAVPPPYAGTTGAGNPPRKGATTPGDPRQPFYKKKWFLIVVGAILLLALINGCLGGGKSASPATTAPTSTLVVPASQPATTQASAPAAPQTTARSSSAPATHASSNTPTATAESLAKRVDASIKNGYAGGQAPDWVLPITKIEDHNPGTVRVYYQQPNMTNCQAESVGRKIFLFTSLDISAKDFDTIILQDANGIDHNVYRDKYKCS